MTPSRQKRVYTRSGQRPSSGFLCKFLLIIFLCLLFFFPTQPAFSQISRENTSPQIDLPGIGTVLIRNSAEGTESEISQILLERPGGSMQILSTLEVMDFVDLLKGDLDGDKQVEIIAVARNRSGDDVMPFIFKPGLQFKQVFPEPDEENPIIGKEISLLPGKGQSILAVRVLVNIHDFGPPDLFSIESYLFQGGKLIRVEERLLEGFHYNQLLNRAGLYFHRGDYLKALDGYQSLLASQASAMPTQACVIAMLYEAESRKFLKDFTGALPLYQKVFTTFPRSAEADRARKEYEFLSKNLQSGKALSLFIDASQLESTNKLTEALHLIEQSLPQHEHGPLGDYLVFLKVEVLVSLGRAGDAMVLLENLCKKVPKSPLIDEAQSLRQELQGNPDETNHLDGNPSRGNQDF